MRPSIPRTAMLFHSLAFAILLVLALTGAGKVEAQMLTRALCPVGSPFNLRPPGWTRYMGLGFPMRRLTIDLGAHPEAVCNDGSPAIMYVRPSNHANPMDEPTNKWLIFFDGGGGCRNEDDCLLTRWCSGGGEIFSRAGKMSSRGAFPAIAPPNGIWNLNPPAPATNHFADYNHVLVHYCSSDSYTGSQSHQGLVTSTGVAFDIEFQGEAIVNAVIETLLGGPTTPDPHPIQHEFPYELPDLDDATDIVLGAESAGSNGLRQHLDRLHDWLEPLTGAPVVGVLEAGFTPWKGDGAILWGNSPYLDYDDFLLSEVAPVMRDFWGADDSAIDASCLDPVYQVDHDAAGVHPEICYDTDYTLLNHITTPVFQRMDINDPLGKQLYGDWMLYTSTDDYWLAMYNQLVTFSTYSPAGGGLEAPERAPGIQGPNCAKHVAVQNNPGFFRSRVTGPAYPTPLTFHDLLENWLNGAFSGPDTVQLQEDNLGAGAYSASLCF